MKEELQTKLIESAMLDLAKPKLTSEEETFILQYTQIQGKYSVRQMAILFNIPPTTMQNKLKPESRTSTTSSNMTLHKLALYIENVKNITTDDLQMLYRIKKACDKLISGDIPEIPHFKTN